MLTFSKLLFLGSCKLLFIKIMASNDNEFIQSSGSYKPPHLRAGFIGVGITMNNDTRYLNNNSKVKSNVLYLIKTSIKFTFSFTIN